MKKKILGVILSAGLGFSGMQAQAACSDVSYAEYVGNVC